MAENKTSNAPIATQSRLGTYITNNPFQLLNGRVFACFFVLTGLSYAWSGPIAFLQMPYLFLLAIIAFCHNQIGFTKQTTFNDIELCMLGLYLLPCYLLSILSSFAFIWLFYNTTYADWFGSLSIYDFNSYDIGYPFNKLFYALGNVENDKVISHISVHKHEDVKSIAVSKFFANTMSYVAVTSFTAFIKVASNALTNDTFDLSTAENKKFNVIPTIAGLLFFSLFIIAYVGGISSELFQSITIKKNISLLNLFGSILSYFFMTSLLIESLHIIQRFIIMLACNIIVFIKS